MSVLNLIPGFSEAKVIGTLALAVGLFGGGFYTAWQYKFYEEQTALAKALEAKEVVQTKQEALTNQAEQTALKVVYRDRVITNTLVKKVPVYVTKIADAGCSIPDGFVRLHDASASGLSHLPDPSPGADAAPSGVALSEVATVVGSNYGSYHQIADQLTQLQNWVSQQKEIEQ